MKSTSSLQGDLPVQLGENGALRYVIENGHGSALEPLEITPSGVVLNSVEVIVQNIKLFCVVDGMHDKFAFDEGTSDGVNTIGVVTLRSAKFVNPRSPSIRIVVLTVLFIRNKCRYVRFILIDTMFVSLPDNDPITKL